MFAYVIEDLFMMCRSMTINDLCMSVAINLQLTQDAGFYRLYEKEKESCTPDRRIVLRDKKTLEFLDDFTGSIPTQLSYNLFFQTHVVYFKI